MKVTIEKNELVIRIALQAPTASKSGKTMIIATTGGNVTTDCMHKSLPVTIGLNAWIKPS